MLGISTPLLARRILIVLALFISTATWADTVLIPAGSTWKYLDNGSNQGTAWRSTSFNDLAWASGPAQLGYGDGDEATTVSFGSNSSNKYITTYFRRSFSVTNPSAFTGLNLNILRDDGAVVYLNGVELLRTNMPSGSISYTTTASSALGSPQESTFYSFASSTAGLVSGNNVLAVEIHQANVTSSDISFDLQLVATDSVSVTRGPYLQLETHNSILVRWRTNAATDSRVRYGLDSSNLSSFTDDLVSTTEHQIALTNLLPNTKYFYSIGTISTVLAGGDANHFFITAPSPGTSKATRVWILGDSGTANANAAAVRDAYLNFNGSRYTDVWLMLGDNAYNDGTDSEFQNAVFNMYPSVLRQTALWPTLGNHDGHTADSASQSGPYYDIFTLPKNAEAGGLASGTEAYYSFDYGNIHFICLESYETNRSTTGPMMTWLQNDVANTTKQWIIAFWHHPPYSKGSHNSDTETELIQMRENALPILENAGVDVVLTGHSHSYERSFLIDGHYGSSSTFTSSMQKDAGSGREDGTGAYEKPTNGPASHEGAVYAVAGSSGQATGGTLNHPAMFISFNLLGSMVLDVNGNRLDAKFIDNTGVIRDYFTLLKGVSNAPNAPGNLNATAVSSQQIDLTWDDLSTNEDGFKIERSADGVSFNQIVTVTADTTSYSNSGLAAGSTYYYRVRAYNSGGNSPYSNIDSATTPGNLPAAPSNLTAAAVSKNQINLSWADNSNNEQGFRIERSTNGTSFSQIATLGAGVTSFANTGLKSNKTYYYRVRAYNAAGNSAYSNVASAKTPRR